MCELPNELFMSITLATTRRSQMNANLSSLLALGQSIWYDNLSKAVLDDGSLKALVDIGLRGLTSNPTIFQKSIAGSHDYDAALKDLQKQQPNADADSLCETLMIGDVGRAADLLRQVYIESKGLDGLASIEVSPTLAHDTIGTIAAGRRIWGALDRPNIMIKVPATDEGLPAIRQLLIDGINVNVTLIFSEQRYMDVANTYIEALHERADKGLPVSGIASVASFFVSRVDAAVEDKFAGLLAKGSVKAEDKARFLGKVGIANSILAYKTFEDLFAGDHFAALKKAGAQVQRPLWASTGTKNPDFDPLLYVEALAVNHTVNTLPPATMDQLIKRTPTITSGYAKRAAEMQEVLDTVEGLGISLSEVLAELEKAGVKSFADSYAALVSSVKEKMQ
jgi:transaldolase